MKEAVIELAPLIILVCVTLAMIAVSWRSCMCTKTDCARVRTQTEVSPSFPGVRIYFSPGDSVTEEAIDPQFSELVLIARQGADGFYLEPEQNTAQAHQALDCLLHSGDLLSLQRSSKENAI